MDDQISKICANFLQLWSDLFDCVNGGGGRVWRVIWKSSTLLLPNTCHVKFTVVTSCASNFELWDHLIRTKLLDFEDHWRNWYQSRYTVYRYRRPTIGEKAGGRMSCRWDAEGPFLSEGYGWGSIFEPWKDSALLLNSMHMRGTDIILLTYNQDRLRL